MARFNTLLAPLIHSNKDVAETNNSKMRDHFHNDIINHTIPGCG